VFLLNGLPHFPHRVLRDPPGVYHWVATYSGDISNNSVSSICANEAVPVLGIVTTQNPKSACAGADLNDSATLSGGNNPKGSITFKLYGTNNCSGSVICTRGPVQVTDNGTFSTPTPCNVAAEGTYYWQACYNSTDGINPSVCSACDAEPVVIEKIPVEISTTANPTRGCVGATLKDSAKLSGGCNPKGKITFTLYDAGDTSCTGPKIFTEDVPVDHVPPSPWTYSTSGGWPTVKAGTYRWIACYTSSDANNDSKCTNCNDPGEVVVIEECEQHGESPYIGIVGNDIDFNPFYFSEKHQQFLFDQEAMTFPYVGAPIRQLRTKQGFPCRRRK